MTMMTVRQPTHNRAHALAHLSFTATLWGKYYSSHFEDKETEAEREAICPKFHDHRVSDRAVTWTQAVWFQSASSSPCVMSAQWVPLNCLQMD